MRTPHPCPVPRPVPGGDLPFLGLDIADLDAGQAAAAIAARPANAAFGYVVTPNADHFARLARQPELAALYRGALLRLMDSRLIARLAGLIGLRAPTVATGSDVTRLLLTRHLTEGERITIVGLRAAHLPALIARCGLAAPAHHDPAMGLAQDKAALRAAVAFVIAHPARFVFLAVGSPAQEILAAAIRESGQAVGTGICCGASLEFLAGAARRAPGWLQHAGLEWLYRLARDPRQPARRYLRDDPPVLAMLLRARFARQSAGA
jgi:N-acetylglucosaminyldiphosphoundecaprenol N-acetyl-beta-D-mannosaminyltransferase